MFINSFFSTQSHFLIMETKTEHQSEDSGNHFDSTIYAIVLYSCCMTYTIMGCM